MLHFWSIMYTESHLTAREPVYLVTVIVTPTVTYNIQKGRRRLYLQGKDTEKTLGLLARLAMSSSYFAESIN